MNLALVKEDERGKVYEADGLKIFYRHKGSISGDNVENTKETIYLVSGSAQFTLQNKAWKENAPAEIMFPAQTYHKIEALTDIVFVLFEEDLKD